MRIAAISKDGTGFDHKVTLRMSGAEVPFVAEGFLPGPALSWRNILAPEDDEPSLPRSLGDLQDGPVRLRTRHTKLTRSFLEPELSEAELLGLMAEARIVTDASAGSHIAMILGLGFARLHATSRTLEPTPLGRALVLAFVGFGHAELVTPLSRARMEAQCRWMEEGESKDRVVRDELRRMLKQFYNFVSTKTNSCRCSNLAWLN